MSLPSSVTIRYEPLGRLLSECQSSQEQWLGIKERRELDRLHDGSRRQQWLAGRWASKAMIRQVAGIAKSVDLQILTRDERGRGVRPSVVVDESEFPWALSISHTESGVLVGLAPKTEFSIGVDLVKLGSRNAAFQQMWYTAGERRWVADDPGHTDSGCWRANVIWSLKEAIYKAFNTGESWDPQRIEILPGAPSQFGCLYHGRMLGTPLVRLRTMGTHVAAVACLPRNLMSSVASGNHLLREAS